MENQELDILIIRYLEGDMNATEKAAFETRLSNDEALKTSLEEYKSITKGIKAFAKTDMKAQLLLVQTAVLKSKSIKDYKPSVNGSGFSFFGLIIKLVFLSAIVTGVLIYFDLVNIQSERFEQIKEKIESEFKLEMRQDTIWKTVSSTKMQKGDTVFIHNQSELDSFYQEIGEEDEWE